MGIVFFDLLVRCKKRRDDDASQPELLLKLQASYSREAMVANSPGLEAGEIFRSPEGGDTRHVA
jgi:hypothetical protein